MDWKLELGKFVVEYFHILVISSFFFHSFCSLTIRDYILRELILFPKFARLPHVFNLEQASNNESSKISESNN